MKPAPFGLASVTSVAQAQAALLGAEDARIIAGGQSLGPILNLRLARPGLLVPVGGLAELAGVAETAEAITLGAGVTHAAVEDGRTPDFRGGLLARIAAGIAYRAVRNRGTIGGSLCHADPAADWPCTLLALSASVIVAGARGARTVPLEKFLLGAFRVALGPGEVVLAVHIPRPSPAARWGYFKACRKPGEFAHAMAAVLLDRGARRAVIGAVGGRPIVLEGDAAHPEAAQALLQASGLDAIACHIQTVALRRAFERAA